ncbi:MAG TPA: carboxypeptidase-like regulatory domain-containing protein, partial [Gemmatimonadaceae bacterium]|nr:carboxypeptidase-like regulatory domain-containing protein [Gemmatimonadaceae bacterium]
MTRTCCQSLERFGLRAAMAFLVAARVVAAQATGAIEGTVTTTGTNQPIGDVQIHLVGTSRAARTDDGGRFRIPGLAPATYQVRAQRIGYASSTTNVSVTAGQTATVTIALREAALSLDVL